VHVKLNVTGEYVPVGAHNLHVDNAAGLQVGEEIVVKRPSTAAWIHTLGVDRITPPRTIKWCNGSRVPKTCWSNGATAIAGIHVQPFSSGHAAASIRGRTAAGEVIRDPSGGWWRLCSQ